MPDSRPDPGAGPGNLLLPPSASGDGLRISPDLDEIDIGAVFAALGHQAPDWTGIDQEEYLADALAARDRDDAPAPVSLAGAVADTMQAGPGLAAWLSSHDPDEVADRDVVAMAASFRRLAAWAQARELAMVARIAARSAARDPDTGLRPDGRPAFVNRDAAAQVSLELVLSRTGAEAWSELAVTLAWRLPATATALSEGQIDLVRAKILAEAVSPLTDEAARLVEAAVLPGAGDQTYAQLHSAVRRAVIAADPDGAEQRRQAAERRAKVALYPDQDCTATLTGTRLPAAHAAAAMARLSAMARALKASGAAGGLHLLRAQVFLGLLLGTLPLIPPAADGTPDTDPPRDDDGCPPGGDDGCPPAEDNGDPPAKDNGGPPAEDDGYPPAEDDGCPPSSQEGRHPAGQDDGGPPGPDGGHPLGNGTARASRGGPATGKPAAGKPGAGKPAAANAAAGDTPRGRRDSEPGDSEHAPATRSKCRSPASGSGRPQPRPDGAAIPGSDLPPARPWTDAPPLTDSSLPPDDGWRDVPPPILPGYVDWDPDRGDPLDDCFADSGVIPAWPNPPVAIESGLPALGLAAPGQGAPGHGARGQAGSSPAGGGGPPPGGLIDLTLPWPTLAGVSDAPGTLGRIGPVTAVQARYLARMGTISHSTQWRLILTDPAGTAIAVARIRHPMPPWPRQSGSALPGESPPSARPADGPPADGPPAVGSGDGPSGERSLLGEPSASGSTPAGLVPTVGRVTVIVPAASLERDSNGNGDGCPPGPGSGSWPGSVRGQAGFPGPELARASARIQSAARRALDTARRQADADRHAPGGCAHTVASTSYRPPPRIRELVIARDQTCRNPRCGQPAWRTDLDHTRPYHLGGRTCPCNLGGACRCDHQLKQLPGWALRQPEPGVFQWVTPAGRTYTTRPDQHHAD